MPLEPERAVGHERRLPRPAFHLHELPVPHERREPRIHLAERVPSGRSPERERPDLGLGEDRRPLLELGDRPRDHFEHPPLGLGQEERRGARAGVCGRKTLERPLGREARNRRRAPSIANDVREGRGLDANPGRAPARPGVERTGRTRLRRRAREPELARPGAPLGTSAPSPTSTFRRRVESAAIWGELRGVGKAVRGKRGEDLESTARERVEHRPIVPRNLEPRHPPDHRRRDGVPEGLKAPCEGVAVIRPDELLAPAKLRGL